MIASILVVCVGNICRSPVGERLLAAGCPDLLVESAGISALIGREADKDFAEIAMANGVNLDSHIARQFDGKMAADFDLILGMERGHLRVIKQLAPETSGKAMLFGQWMDQSDIADPYQRSSEFQAMVFDQLRDASAGWVAKLKGNRND